MGVGNSSTGTTIGGTAAGAANTIAFNAGAAVAVFSGSGNAIREDLIYGNTQDIVLSAGANNNQAAPSNLAVSSVPGLTTIDYTINGTVGQAYTIDFFASERLGGPAAEFLGTVTTPALTSATQGFAATFNLAARCERPAGDGDGDRPEQQHVGLRDSGGARLAVLVTNTNDSGVGSLRQAILNANVSPGSPITFDFTGTGPFVDQHGDRLLPNIAVPVTIDGTSQPGYAFGTAMVELDGASSGGGDGLVLAAGSDGSTIKGLDIGGFSGGAAIRVESAGDLIASDELGVTSAGPTGGNRIGVLIDGAAGATIGGTAAGAGDLIGFNPTAGIQIVGSSTVPSTDALVVGDGIGTDPTGAQAWAMAPPCRSSARAGTRSAARPPGRPTRSDSTPPRGSPSSRARRMWSTATPISGPMARCQTPSVAASDIGVAVGANNGLQPPALAAASLSSDGSTLGLALAAPATAAAVLDVYVEGAARRTFLGEVTLAAGATSTSLAVAGSVVTGSSEIVATQTVAADGTSAFSAPQPVATQSTVTNTNASGPGSLAAAVAAADAGGGTDIIFRILGAGPFLISLASPLAITVPMRIDGSSELGAGGTPAIVLSGAGAGIGLDLAPGSGGSTIDGLEFIGFTQSDILVESSGNSIGGTSVPGNVFSTNGAAGVSITGANNVLEANFIGTDSAGDELGGGQKPGVVVAGGGNTIGGNGRRRRQYHRLLIGGRVDHRLDGRAERRAGELHRHECPGSLPRERTRRGDRRRIEQQGGRDRAGRRQHDRLQPGRRGGGQTSASATRSGRT